LRITTDTSENRAARAAYCGSPTLVSHSMHRQAAACRIVRSARDSMAPVRVAAADHLTVLRARAAGLRPLARSARYTDKPVACSLSQPPGSVPRIRRPGHGALGWTRAAPGARTPVPAALALMPWQRVKTPGPCADSPAAIHAALYRQPGG